MPIPVSERYERLHPAPSRKKPLAGWVVVVGGVHWVGGPFAEKGSAPTHADPFVFATLTVLPKMSL